MLDSLALYSKMIAASARAQASYRANFVASIFGTFLVTVIEFVGVWALFARFGSLDGWSLPQVAFLYGLVNVVMAVADALATGFDSFHNEVRTGGFDRVLLRPRSTVFQMFAVGVATRRIGRFVQALIVLAWAIPQLDIPWTADGGWRLALVAFTALCGVALFLGLFIIQATAAFWTVEALEAFNAFHYGGTYAAQYPVTIYDGWFRRFFTFVIPLACVTYFPATLILDQPDPLDTPAWLRATAPLAGPLFLAFALRLWSFGVRHYTSTGS